ncbi:hypothetical protein TEA_017354 [Camellia sinensis var. sinensis]|uniref:Ubiquitin-like protease family profile domain-containing protein n=1 Tax=Camellia sinensis var. sinensis TaxID=542762 RepID=A0A4S4EJ65_CAMSN|nr:hypothetical protein TEA_017354 [Camellia sinensis var. sinensis]
MHTAGCMLLAAQMRDRSGNIRGGMWQLSNLHHLILTKKESGESSFHLKFLEIVAVGVLLYCFMTIHFLYLILIHTLLQPQFLGTLVLELDWLPLRTDKNDPLVLCIAGADSSFRLVEINVNDKRVGYEPRPRSMKERFRPMPLCSPILLLTSHALALHMILQLGVKPAWFNACSTIIDMRPRTASSTGDLRSYMIDSLLCYEVCFCVAATFGEFIEALFWLQIPYALDHLMNKLVKKSPQIAPVPESIPKLDDTVMLSRITSKELWGSANECITWHEKLDNEEAIQNRVHELVSVENLEVAVSLLLFTHPKSTYFYTNALRAVTLSSAVSWSLLELAVKVVAANMVRIDRLLSGTHLLCAIGRLGLDEESIKDKRLLLPKLNPQNEDVIAVVGSIENIVAHGTVYERIEPNEAIHMVPLGEANLHVSIQVVIQNDAHLPIPIPDEMFIVGEAVGFFVAWPKNLVLVSDEGASINVECGKYQESIQSFVALVEHIKYDKAIDIPPEKDIFGEEINTQLQRVDMEYICHVKELFVTCIMLYISGKTMAREKSKSVLLARRLEKAMLEQLIFIPYNNGYHWILLVIDLTLMYLLDPIHSKINTTLEIVINTSMEKRLTRKPNLMKSE